MLKEFAVRNNLVWEIIFIRLQVANSVQGVNFVWFGLLKHCSQRSCEICSIFGIDMGCVRVRGGAAGGLRLSMERRRLLNAQITATRHRKYQQLRIQIEEEDMKMAAEILERRKRERARLAAYIHSVYEAPPTKRVSGVNGQPNGGNGRGQLFNRPPWSISLLQDQEAILKLRRKELAVARAAASSDKKRRDYNPAFQGRTTALRDAMVDLRACNSRYQIDDGGPAPGYGYKAYYNEQMRDDVVVDHQLHGLAMTGLNNNISIAGGKDVLISEHEEFSQVIAVRQSRSLTAPTASAGPGALKPCLKLKHETPPAGPCTSEDEKRNPLLDSTNLQLMCTTQASSTATSVSPPIAKGVIEYPVVNLSSSPTCYFPGPSMVARQDTFSRSCISPAPECGIISEKKTSFLGSNFPSKDFHSVSQIIQTTCFTPPKKEGDTTSDLTKELSLAARENEAATQQVIKQVNAVQSHLEGCKLMPLDLRGLSKHPSHDRTGCVIEDGIADTTSKVMSADAMTLADNRKETQALYQQLRDRDHPLVPSQSNSRNLNTEEMRMFGHQISKGSKVAKSTTEQVQATMSSGTYHNDCAVVYRDTCGVELQSQIDTLGKVQGGSLIPTETSESSAWNIDRQHEARPPLKKRDLEVCTAKVNDQHFSSTNIMTVPTPSVTVSSEHSREKIHCETTSRLAMPFHRVGKLDSTQNVQDAECNDVCCVRSAEQHVPAAQNHTSPCATLNVQHKKENQGDVPNRARPSAHKAYAPRCNLQSVYEQCGFHGEQPPSYRVLCSTHCHDLCKNSKPKWKCVQGEPHPLTAEPERDSFHDLSGDKENDGKVNYYSKPHVAQSEEELRIFASLERLDAELAVITGRTMNSGRDFLASQGHYSTKSAPTVLAQDGPASTTLGQVSLAMRSRPKHSQLPFPRPASAKALAQKPQRALRQRHQVGVTNKGHGEVHQFYPKSHPKVPAPALLVDAKPIARLPSSPGSILCYKDPYYLLNSLDSL